MPTVVFELDDSALDAMDEAAAFGVALIKSGGGLDLRACAGQLPADGDGFAAPGETS